MVILCSKNWLLGYLLVLTSLGFDGAHFSVALVSLLSGSCHPHAVRMPVQSRRPWLAPPVEHSLWVVPGCPHSACPQPSGPGDRSLAAFLGPALGNAWFVLPCFGFLFLHHPACPATAPQPVGNFELRFPSTNQENRERHF